MRGMVASCAAGKAGGMVCLDLNQPEDNHGEADLPIAINMTTGEVVLLQMDGNMSPEEFETALRYATKGCEDLYKLQKQALVDRYTEVIEGGA
jgi:exosome complex component RRP41